MDRTAAVSLVAKLEALADPTRGGTPAECALAREKADALIAKFSLNRRETCPKATPPPRSFTAPRRGGAWAFDHMTGAAAPNVKVHSYKSPSEWKIEIF